MPVFALFLFGCGLGSPAVDVTGTWLAINSMGGEMTVNLRQDGDSVQGVGATPASGGATITGTISDEVIELTVELACDTQEAIATIAGDSMSGTLTNSGCSGSFEATWTAIRQ